MRFLCVLLVFIATPALAKQESFDHWLAQFKKDALSQGIKQQTLDTVFTTTAPMDDVIKLDRKQPEGSKTLPEYLEVVLNGKRIEEGKRLAEENEDILKAIEKKYGVDREIIVALWGIETSYGENTGNYPVVDVLATLAYEGRRRDFFHDELINALKILDGDHITVEEMSGSWAGAMGQCQFMPSSFLKYAVDYNDDGKRDIWNTTDDVFASIAHYLESEGWKLDGEISMPVQLPANFDMALTDIKTTKTTRQWRDLGVTYNDGSPLVNNALPASVIMVGRDADAVPYIVYDNYKVILKWNRSRYFATAVDMLSEEIRAD
ncbi:MAG: lytic murein transglycosylase [Alphaproteobacteria bacterium]|nr:lytic murein transglycosylase [Alphaproteobacteria bacterium]